MISVRHGGAVLVWAPAKVNLFLEVYRKRPDGYHDIATLLVAVSLFDTLEFQEEASGRVVLTSDHPTLSTGPDNLIAKAAELVRQRTGCTRGATIRLRKRIPLAAGLAGGSTDAAAALEGLNQLWNLKLHTQDLAALAAELGSDVPFFLATPAAWCTGRGEMVEPVPLGCPLWLVLVCPATGLKTAEVYRRVTIPVVSQSGEAMRAAVAAGAVESVARALHNRLEEPALALAPEVADHLRRLEDCGPAGRLMSGSGTSVFALCRDRIEARRIAHEIRRGPYAGPHPSIFLVRSCSSGTPQIEKENRCGHHRSSH